ncbi:Wzz/FepE/Etk N-terminal domain-containing protein [Robiginitalea sp. M366]|uniref:GumC family protein n=1 Tax=Robiginitalea aestuariiviva TaxID=3036903 RepID=UPI00240D1148|nr:tyrosine-protein kinase family protein [Robiginitalea aestuariiviva]MDG1572746.1 Wzz/FepE/Etk N-terminal domain-containing protein [Robiginitalea aestuariiviva]
MALDSNERFSLRQINLHQLLSPYKKGWYWFVLCVFVFGILAYVYNRYTTPSYGVQASIRLQLDEGTGSELGAFQDLQIMQDRNDPIQDEIQIIKSRSNFIELVQTLNLNTQIFLLGNIMDSEIYGRQPFSINYVDSLPGPVSAGFSFYITPTTTSSFAYSAQEDAPGQPMTFGSRIATPMGNMILIPDAAILENYLGRRFKVVVSPVVAMAEHYRREVQVVPWDSKSSNFLNLYLQDPVTQKAKDILNTLIRIYNKNAAEEKRQIADKTASFIDARISEIYENLYSVDTTAEAFKTQRGRIDIGAESNLNLSAGVENRQQLENANIQLSIAAAIRDDIQSQDGYTTLSAPVGISDPSIAEATARYNSLVAQRRSLLESSGERNPVVEELDRELNALKGTLLSGLESTVNNLNLTLNSLNKQQSRINARIYSAPGDERRLRDIARKQQTTESLYLYLLEKREEAQIAFASTAPRSVVVDAAYALSNTPVHPQKMRNYLLAIMLGLAIPFAFLYVQDLLDTKVKSKMDLEQTVGDLPVLAELPRLGPKQAKLVTKEDRSVLAEAMRILRSNLDFVIQSKAGKSGIKKILVTSGVPGEGKTLTAVNLSLILAFARKKVLLIGADIRNPRIKDYLKAAKPTAPQRDVAMTGLTDYLYDPQLKEGEIVQPYAVTGGTVDIIYSGKIPPNPAELLMNDRIGALMSWAEAQGYEYVVMDSAPMMVVSDTQVLGRYVDQTLYVVKAGFTDKRVLDYPVKLAAEKKVENLSFVVNAVVDSNLGYGGKYGYGYGRAPKKWWQFG